VNSERTVSVYVEVMQVSSFPCCSTAGVSQSCSMLFNKCERRCTCRLNSARYTTYVCSCWTCPSMPIELIYCVCQSAFRVYSSATNQGAEACLLFRCRCMRFRICTTHILSVSCQSRGSSRRAQLDGVCNCKALRVRSPSHQCQSMVDADLLGNCSIVNKIVGDSVGVTFVFCLHDRHVCEHRIQWPIMAANGCLDTQENADRYQIMTAVRHSE
jgi:hypothetical protein